MQKRDYCQRCQYPVKTCICDALAPIKSRFTISIMQDPAETKHAKNTARIIPLLMPNAQIHIGETPTDFVELIRKVKDARRSLVLYPCEAAKELDELTHGSEHFDHIMLLDGTWRKAKKLWLSNPWLHDIDTAVIAAQDQSQYVIRKRPHQQSLSTLEALAFTLNNLEDQPLERFFAPLNLLQAHWLRFRPN